MKFLHHILKKKLALKLGKFENVEFSRCADIVKVDKTMMYKCKYCAIFDTAQVDSVRAHLYSHYITVNGYPLDNNNTSLSSSTEVTTDQIGTSGEESLSGIQPIEIVPESQQN